jgi:hypothetical protein
LVFAESIDTLCSYPVGPDTTYAAFFFDEVVGQKRLRKMEAGDGLYIEIERKDATEYEQAS